MYPKWCPKKELANKKNLIKCLTFDMKVKIIMIKGTSGKMK